MPAAGARRRSLGCSAAGKAAPLAALAYASPAARRRRAGGTQVRIVASAPRAGASLGCLATGPGGDAVIGPCHPALRARLHEAKWPDGWRRRDGHLQIRPAGPGDTKGGNRAPRLEDTVYGLRSTGGWLHAARLSHA
jgi:hypothetical protein